jgi:hypothetical protein
MSRRIDKRNLQFLRDGLKLWAMARKRKLPDEALKFFKAEGRKGGLEGGKIRAEKLSPKRRKEIAQKAAQARWGKKKGPKGTSP